MSATNRDERIEALGYSLFNALNTDTKGCHWTEVPEAIGLLLKIYGTAVATASEADHNQVERISTVMDQGFVEGYKRTAVVQFK